MNEQSPKEEVVDKKKEKELKKREEKERKEREKREKADREKAKKEEEKRKKEEEKRRKDMEKAEKPASPKKAESAPAPPVAHTPHSGKTIRATAVLLDGEKHEVELEVNSESNMYFPVYDNGSGSLCCFCHPYPHP